MSLSVAATPVFPASHLDLLDGANFAALTTLMPDGQPQTTPVWYNRDGDYLLINSMRAFRKTKNMRRDPRVTLLIYDPRKPLHNIEVRGCVEEMTEEGALEHLDALTALYMGKPDAHFFGDSIPAHFQATHVPVKIRIRPLRVRAEQGALNLKTPKLADYPVPASTATADLSAVLPLPASHLDLFSRPVHGVLATRMPDGQPQASVVWTDYDGEYVLLNTTLERRKGQNMLADPRVTLLVVDPENTSRWIEVRGAVADIVRGAEAESHADKLTQRYSSPKRQFYGDIYPESQRERETRVMVKIRPTKIALDAIFK